MNFISTLTFQDIYNYGKTPNILKYKDITIPCFCKFIDNNICIEAKTYFTIDMFEKLKNMDLKINDIPFYVSDLMFSETNVGEYVILKFNLISKKPFEIEQIKMWGI